MIWYVSRYLLLKEFDNKGWHGVTKTHNSNFILKKLAEKTRNQISLKVYFGEINSAIDINENTQGKYSHF